MFKLEVVNNTVIALTSTGKQNNKKMQGLNATRSTLAFGQYKCEQCVLYVKMHVESIVKDIFKVRLLHIERGGEQTAQQCSLLRVFMKNISLVYKALYTCIHRTYLFSQTPYMNT